jgi:hypothetical protein
MSMLLGRIIAAAGKAIVTAAANKAAEELRRPETRGKLADAAQEAAYRGARSLGRTVGRLQNSLGAKTPDR